MGWPSSGSGVLSVAVGQWFRGAQARRARLWRNPYVKPHGLAPARSAVKVAASQPAPILSPVLYRSSF